MCDHHHFSVYLLSKKRKKKKWFEEMVSCFQSCSGLLWEKHVLVIKKNFEITRTILETRYHFLKSFFFPFFAQKIDWKMMMVTQGVLASKFPISIITRTRVNIGVKKSKKIRKIMYPSQILPPDSCLWENLKKIFL